MKGAGKKEERGRGERERGIERLGQRNNGHPVQHRRYSTDGLADFLYTGCWCGETKRNEKSRTFGVRQRSQGRTQYLSLGAPEGRYFYQGLTSPTYWCCAILRATLRVFLSAENQGSKQRNLRILRHILFLSRTVRVKSSPPKEIVMSSNSASHSMTTSSTFPGSSTHTS